MSFDAFLREPSHNGKIRHVVVSNDDRIVGVLRVNTGIRRGLESAYTGVTLDDVASRDFTIAHEEDIMFGVIGRMWQRDAMMVVVVRGNGKPLSERRARGDNQRTRCRLGCAQCSALYLDRQQEVESSSQVLRGPATLRLSVTARLSVIRRLGSRFQAIDVMFQ